MPFSAAARQQELASEVVGFLFSDAVEFEDALGFVVEIDQRWREVRIRLASLQAEPCSDVAIARVLFCGILISTLPASASGDRVQLCLRSFATSREWCRRSEMA